MTLWEIINPSDPYTLACDDFKLAAVACCVLGHDKYALQEHGGERKVPLFFFGGSEEWFIETFQQGVSECIGSADRDALATVLDSVMIGSLSTREAYETALEHMDEGQRSAYRAKVHDQQRSSMNDIGSRAWAIARALRESK